MAGGLRGKEEEEEEVQGIDPDRSKTEHAEHEITNASGQSVPFYKRAYRKLAREL